MKKVYYFVFFSVLFLARNLLSAQTVSNISVIQDATIVVINYNLESTTPCEVSLFLSADNGITWQGLLNDCTGDIGMDIVGGQKQIRWNVLASRNQLVGTGFIFKIKAIGRKEFEPEMVFVEGGTFQMGSNSGQVNERPVHSVELNSFSMGKYEVTQAQWKAVMGNNPSEFNGCDMCPVEKVTWSMVQLYISKLNSLTGKSYRLPTEEEWEYAAKGGKNSNGYLYSGSDDIDIVAWYSGNSLNRTHLVGSKMANELGIYDMSGNVPEWCSDIFIDYGNKVVSSHQGKNSYEMRVFRGGSNGGKEAFCLSTYRDAVSPYDPYIIIGFRLVHP